MIGHRRLTRIVQLSALAILLSCLDLHAQDRMPPLPADTMTEAQKKAAADYAAQRNAALSGGPFGVMLRVPELMDLAFKWRQHVSCEVRHRAAADRIRNPHHRATLDAAVPVERSLLCRHQVRPQAGNDRRRCRGEASGSHGGRRNRRVRPAHGVAAKS